MTRDDLVEAGLSAWPIGTHAREKVVVQILDAVEPLIQGDEVAKFDAVWRGAHAQYKRELRAAIEALPTIRHRTGSEPNVDSFGFAVDLQAVLNLIDGGSDA